VARAFLLVRASTRMSRNAHATARSSFLAAV
jgi:hypothetical protein